MAHPPVQRTNLAQHLVARTHTHGYSNKSSIMYHDVLRSNLSPAHCLWAGQCRPGKCAATWPCLTKCACPQATVGPTKCPCPVLLPTPARRNMPLHLPLFLILHLPPPLHCGRVASGSGSSSASTSASASTVSRNRKCFIFKYFPLDGNRKCLNKGTHGTLGHSERHLIFSEKANTAIRFDLLWQSTAIY